MAEMAYYVAEVELVRSSTGSTAQGGGTAGVGGMAGPNGHALVPTSALVPGATQRDVNNVCYLPSYVLTHHTYKRPERRSQAMGWSLT